MIKYNLETIGYINLFEKVTGAKVKDCFLDSGQIIFIVQPGQGGRAIGKKGQNIKKISNLLKKRIRVIEFHIDLVKFIKTLIYPLEADDIVLEDKIVNIKIATKQTKSILIGRDKKNLNNLQNLINKYFKGYNIKIS